jgi:apolipoprotein N-acyltransferase
MSMSHEEFILGYDRGDLGCSVSTPGALKLFLRRQAGDTKIQQRLGGWLLGFSAIGVLIVWLFLTFGVGWALFAALALFGLALNGFSHHLSELVIEFALEDEDFFRLAVAQHALWLATDNEGNMPKARKVVPMRRQRRANR